MQKIERKDSVMGKVILGTTMSLDGFMTDRKGDIGVLYPDLAALRQTQELRDSIAATGAALMGRRTYDMAQGDLTGYEYQVPIFVVTHHPSPQPPKGQNERLKVFFVTDGIESAVRQAQAAAGDKDVTFIGGASLAQQILRAGLADELHIGIVPLLLGAGLRFFEPEGRPEVKLELIQTLESPGRTDLHFRIVK